MVRVGRTAPSFGRPRVLHVGTPSNRAALCRWVLRRMASSLKAGCNTSVMSYAIALLITTFPYRCEHGSALTIVSASVLERRRHRGIEQNGTMRQDRALWLTCSTRRIADRARMIHAELKQPDSPPKVRPEPDRRNTWCLARVSSLHRTIDQLGRRKAKNNRHPERPSKPYPVSRPCF